MLDSRHTHAILFHASGQACVMHQARIRAYLFDRLLIDATKYDTGIRRRGSQSQRDLLAAVQSDSGHFHGSF